MSHKRRDRGIKFKSKASEAMAAQLCFTERRAAAILEMRLYKLIGLEIEALIKEHEETRAKIAEYSDILEHRSSMAKVIMKELKAFRKRSMQGTDARSLTISRKLLWSKKSLRYRM